MESNEAQPLPLEEHIFAVVQAADVVGGQTGQRLDAGPGGLQ